MGKQIFRTKYTNNCHCCYFITVTFMDMRVRSEGCDDPGKAPDTCGIAYIYVHGVDHSLHRRGHNIVVVNGQTGKMDFSWFSLINNQYT